MAAFDFGAWQERRDCELEQRMRSIFDRVWDSTVYYSPMHTSPEEQRRLYEGYLSFWKEEMGNTHLDVGFPSYMSESMIRPKGFTSFCSRLCRWQPTVMHEHEFFEFNFLVGGECLHFTGDRVLRLREGDVLLIPPGTKHQPVMQDENCTMYSVGVSNTKLPRIFGHLWQGDHPLINYMREKHSAVSVKSCCRLHLDVETQRRMLYPLVTERLDLTDPFAVQSGELFLERILLDMMRKAASIEVVDDDPRNLQNGEEILYYIGNHFKTVSRKELAEYFAYSERQITRLLYKLTGKSLTEYISEVRMNYVADMLTATQAPIYEIIEASGYQNNNYFYQSFRERFGTTPADYRAQRWMSGESV